MTLPGDKDLFVAGYCCQFIFFAPHTSTNASRILCKNIYFTQANGEKLSSPNAYFYVLKCLTQFLEAKMVFVRKT